MTLSNTVISNAQSIKVHRGQHLYSRNEKTPSIIHLRVKNLISSTGQGNVHTNLDKSINSEKEKYNTCNNEILS